MKVKQPEKPADIARIPESPVEIGKIGAAMMRKRDKHYEKREK